MNKLELAERYVQAAKDADAAGSHDAAEAYEQLALLLLEEHEEESNAESD